MPQGSANILNGFFFGMEGVNDSRFWLTSAGSRARLSGIVAALAILAYFVWSPVIEPVANQRWSDNGCDRDI
jgi:MFS superfamily sulfate permease-like transporter